MRKNKICMLLLALVFSCFVISAVSAQDALNINSTNMGITENEDCNLQDVSEEMIAEDCCEENSENDLTSNGTKIWYVNPDPDNPNQVQKPTVQPVINQANSGDTIVLNGTFIHCHFMINKTLTILATPGTSVGVCPHHNHPSGSDTFGVFYINSEANGTVIDGLTFTNDFFHIANVQQNPFAVLVDGASNIDLRNLVINWTGVKVNDKDPMDYIFNPIIVRNAINITLNNVFLNNTGIGVNITNSKNIKFENLTVLNSKEMGILIGKNSSEISINYKTPEIMAPKKSKLTLEDLNVLVGDKTKIYMTLKDSENNAIVNKNITVFVNGMTKNIVTDENGIAELSMSFQNEGVFYVTASFLGDDDYKTSIDYAKITVSKKQTSLKVTKKTYKAKATKKVIIALKSNNSPIIGKKITLKVNGKTYSGKTNSKGVVAIKVKITKKGVYKYAAKFAGDAIYKVCSKTGKITVKK